MEFDSARSASRLSSTSVGDIDSSGLDCSHELRAFFHIKRTNVFDRNRKSHYSGVYADEEIARG